MVHAHDRSASCTARRFGAELPPLTPNKLSLHIVRVLAVVMVALAAGAASWLTAGAQPAVTPLVPLEPSVLSATLESSSTAVPTLGTFGYTAHIRLSTPASYLQTRIRVRRPSGRLVFQRTAVANMLPAGEHTASFGRTLQGIDLQPGAYPVEIEIRADANGSTVTTEIATELLVYDPAEKSAGVVLITRIDAPPLEAPDGRFAVDPAVATKARDDVATIASLILAEDEARLTLGVPPVLLAQWERAADGYTMTDGTEVAATAPGPVSYATTLDLLRQAVATGRLELLTTGLADPDLAQLAARGRSADVVPHYEEGLSATFASVETSPSTGTVPAGVCIPPSSLPALKGLGIGWVGVDVSCAHSGDSTVTSGSYPIADSSLRALLSDTVASAALTSGETSTAVSRMALLQIRTPGQPVVVRVELAEGTANATSTVVPAVRSLQTQLWTRMKTGRETQTPAKTKSIRLLTEKPESSAPSDYWTTVTRARTYSEALMASLGPTDSSSSSAQTDSLIAEASAWAAPEGSWSGADRGLQFAEASLKTSKSILDAISINIQPVTLSSARGEVPVSLQNGTEKTLRVLMRTSTAGGIDVEGREQTPTLLRPQETFVQIPVNMHSALSGKLTVELLAGDMVVAARTVDVKGSYLDRLVIIGGIVLALGILLAFIVRRVRSVELAERQAEEDAERMRSHDPRYTSGSADAPQDSEDQ